MSPLSCRSLLKGAAALGGTPALPTWGFAQTSPRTALTVGTRTL